jgi:hypothetical protein
MANEVTVSVSLAFSKSGKTIEFSKKGKQLDVSGDDYLRRTQVIGTSEEALDIGDIATPGYFIGWNNDTTNYVSIRSGTGAANCVELKPGGEPVCFRFARGATAPFAIANTANCTIEYLIIED